MLDAQPIAGKATSPWIASYGQTLSGCKAGPWINSVFKGNIVYVHILDWPKEGVHLNAIPRKLLSARSVTGDIQVRQDEKGWLLTGTPDPLNTIVQLEFDSSVEDIAMALPSAGSLTAGRERLIQSANDSSLIVGVNLGSVKTINRFEFTIDNPGYLRGQGRPFEIQVKWTDGTWKTVYQGNVFGITCAKKIDPVVTSDVRLVVKASGVKQFDLFN